MAPITWTANNKSALLNMDSNGLEVNYTGRGNNYEDVVIYTNNPIPLQCKLFYFAI